jgi:hypothetical protein
MYVYGIHGTLAIIGEKFFPAIKRLSLVFCWRKSNLLRSVFKVGQHFLRLYQCEQRAVRWGIISIPAVTGCVLILICL